MGIAFLSRLSLFCDLAGNHAAQPAFFSLIRLSDYTNARAVILTITPSFRRVESKQAAALGRPCLSAFLDQVHPRFERNHMEVRNAVYS